MKQRDLEKLVLLNYLCQPIFPRDCNGCHCQGATRGGTWVCEIRVLDFLC